CHSHNFISGEIFGIQPITLRLAASELIEIGLIYCDSPTKRNPGSVYAIQSTAEMTQSSTLLEPANDEVHEFDVDVLYSWEQSSGTISYEAWSSNLEEAFNIDKNGKMIS
ncbi:unnamed protein product, partial [Onchocerca ochengi]